MKRKNVWFLISLMLLILAGCDRKDYQTQVQDESYSLKSASTSGKYIVTLNEEAVISKSDLQTRNEKVKQKAYGLLKKYEITGEIEEVYETALQGFTIKIAPGQAKKLAFDSDVKNVEADRVIALSPVEMNGKTVNGGKTQPSQIIPFGIGRVGGGLTYTGANFAWIIDTGVDYTHPDLNINKDLAKSFTKANSADDDNGHGTHVAGIIAAIDNSIGVIGVAANAKVIPVKVLDRKGNGTISGVIAGVNYVASKGIDGDVANMSLGVGLSTSLDEAVLGASSKVKFVLAAGNEGDDAINHSPARVNGPNIYTISAMDQLDGWASWSNYGTPVDYCAPGVSVISTYKGGGYAELSGTSMAAPHVTGLLLLGKINTDKNVIGDPDGDPDPIAHH